MSSRRMLGAALAAVLLTGLAYGWAPPRTIRNLISASKTLTIAEYRDGQPAREVQVAQGSDELLRIRGWLESVDGGWVSFTTYAPGLKIHGDDFTANLLKGKLVLYGIRDNGKPTLQYVFRLEPSEEREIREILETELAKAPAPFR